MKISLFPDLLTEKIRNFIPGFKSTQLIKDVYDNSFGIDLKKIHLASTSNKPNEKTLIDEINRSGRVLFDDGISSSFKLKNIEGLNYLIGDNTIYPCSSVVETFYGGQLNWVLCFALPDKSKFIGETDIRKSGIIINYFEQVIQEIDSEDVFVNFMSALDYSFSDNNWFKRNDFITNYYRKVPFWTVEQKIDRIFSEGLVSPRKYLTYVIFRNERLNISKLSHTLRRSLSDATKKVIPEKDFQDFLERLTEKEVEEFFCMDYLRSQTKPEFLTYNLFAEWMMVHDNDYEFGSIKNEADHEKNMYYSEDSSKNFYSLLKRNYRNLENHIRQEKGFEEVGSFVMETFLYNKLVKELPDYTIIRQYSPKWLFGQRFDIFIKEINLAVEYNGIQHFKPIAFFGGKDGLKRTKILDQMKRERAALHNVRVFDINYDDNFEEKFSVLLSYFIA